MENKKLTCSDCKREFICEYEVYPDKCDCYECDNCFEISCKQCAYDGLQRLCKKCQKLAQDKYRNYKYNDSK